MLRRILVPSRVAINHLKKASYKPFSTRNYQYSERQFTDGFKAVEVQQMMQASEFQNYSALYSKPEKEDDDSKMPKGFEKFLKKSREGRKKTDDKKEEKKAQKKKDEEDDELSEEEEPEVKKDKKE